ncbi:type II toxin-antitoxin system VapC family toxin [Actinotignum urinale]|uniref:Type II toxin-antitoxin system VapC family toxin n=1 Tax=Actinotignum urinale TaxID=190146 RepID=A0AAW9HZJ0_9ACTO|nr:type II toxin-antitoxin system VapC family toxin [Actinotignum urinale]MDY5132207.1 type II toxin-antitoxin system VapC family toxin [Actinotignum urinale]MDY5155434.1 type II toxin-antitoxin system VapC family toxin [Actinotignum urinale]MDY5160865.1 type II toxin-antitoxin system VapC family toxin [Actinotignum urinale]WIK59123.1 type II toxin-antitoxin system VapC family toxin [Actinotignum urinale]
MQYVYVDASVAVFALDGDPSVARWFDGMADQGRLISSRILQTEITRVLRRQKRDVFERDKILDSIATIPIDEMILTMAESIVPHIKTLDSIHLASALRLGGLTTVATHNENMARVAHKIGLKTVDPLDAS